MARKQPSEGKSDDMLHVGISMQGEVLPDILELLKDAGYRLPSTLFDRGEDTRELPGGIELWKIKQADVLALNLSSYDAVLTGLDIAREAELLAKQNGYGARVTRKLLDTRMQACRLVPMVLKQYNVRTLSQLRKQNFPFVYTSYPASTRDWLQRVGIEDCEIRDLSSAAEVTAARRSAVQNEKNFSIEITGSGKTARKQGYRVYPDDCRKNCSAKQVIPTVLDTTLCLSAVLDNPDQEVNPRLEAFRFKLAGTLDARGEFDSSGKVMLIANLSDDRILGTTQTIRETLEITLSPTIAPNSDRYTKSWQAVMEREQADKAAMILRDAGATSVDMIPLIFHMPHDEERVMKIGGHAYQFGQDFERGFEHGD